MRAATAAVALAVAVGTAACGSSSSGSSTTGPGTATLRLSGSPSPDPLRPTRGLPVQPRVLPTTPADTTGTAAMVSLGWQYAGQRDGGRTVLIRSYVSGCTTFDHVQVQQSTDNVEIAVIGRRSGGVGPGATGDSVCPALALILSGAVHLSAPLGSRQLLHAPLTPAAMAPLRQP